MTSLMTLLAALAFISFGQLIVVMTAGIDISVGPLSGLVAVIASFFVVQGKSTSLVIIGQRSSAEIALLGEQLGIREHLLLLENKPYAEVVKTKEAHDLLEGYFKEVNKSLAKYESVKNFAILPKDLSIDDGELTPSLKVKRKVVAERFRSQIEEMYA